MLNAQKLKLLVFIVLIGFVFVGCQPGTDGNTDGNGQTDGSTPIDSTIRIQWWGVFWDPEVVQPLIDEYESQHSNIEIIYDNKWPGNDYLIAEGVYKTELERELFSNDPDRIPDIFMAKNTWAGNYDELYTSPAPVSAIDAATVEAAFYPAVTTDFVTDGNVNGLPLWMDTFAILYNKDLLEEEAVSVPDAEWIGFRNLARDLTRFDGSQYGFAAGSADNVTFAPELLTILFFQNDINMVNAAGQPVFANSGFAESTLDFFKQFTEASVVGSWSDNLGNDALAFLNGEVAMIFAPLWRYNDIVFFNDTYNLGLDIGIAGVPQLDTTSPVNLASYWGAMVAKNRPQANRNASWDFLVWITQKEQLRKLRVNDLAREIKPEGFLYPRSDMRSELLQSSTKIAPYINALPNARSWYQIDGRAVNSVLREAIRGGDASDLAAAQSDIRNIIENKGILNRN